MATQQLTEPVVTSRFRSGDLAFREVQYPDGYDMPVHEHDIDCLVLVLQGALTGALGRDEFAAPDSTLLFLPAWRPHSTRNFGSVRTFDVVLSSGFSSENREVLPKRITPVLEVADSSIADARRMHREMSCPDIATPLILSDLTIGLLSRLSNPAPIGTRRPAWLGKVVDFIHGGLSATVSLKDVSQAVAVDPAHLTRVFRKHYGCSIGCYARRLRLDRACADLSKSDKPLSDLAFEAGFSDQSHFTRAFKEYTGLTPRQYRQLT